MAGGTAGEGARRRRQSVDVLRGALLALMLFTPASGAGDTFTWLRHAHWNGLTLSDLIFPGFLVTSGMGLAFLLRPPVTSRTVRRLAIRFVVLVALGLVYNAYFESGFDLSRLRFTGVLQTIAVTGAFGAAAVLVTRRGNRDRPLVLLGVATALTAAYGASLELREPDCTTAGARCSPWFSVDQVLGDSHLYRGGQAAFDPEGLMVMVAATALVILGYLGGRVLGLDLTASRLRLGRTTTGLLLAGGGALLTISATLDRVQPVNKRLLTPAFVTVAAGVTLALLAVLIVVVDRQLETATAEEWRSRAIEPFVALGRNALVVFLGERFLLQTARNVSLGNRTIDVALREALPIGAPGVHLAYTVLLLLLIGAVTLALHRRRWYLAL